LFHILRERSVGDIKGLLQGIMASRLLTNK